MGEQTPAAGGALSRSAASAAIGDLGWRYILGAGRAYVRVGSLAQGAKVATVLAAAAGAVGDDCLRLDLRHDRVLLTVQSPSQQLLTGRETGLAQRISQLVSELGLATEAGVGSDSAHLVQDLEIAIDALDIAAVRPFWQAVLGYVDEPWGHDPGAGLIDPLGQRPALWFQQMDAPRPQRNRIHFDICVPHDEAQRRIQAALAAGGTLVSDAEAPAFWILADPEGNEACVTTWQGRDP
ncbi:MAG TPA: VOC family protein [Streptosporangiaceae bacterium]|jgi:4a-hydroxytetrahydrobiopterin dehydratase